MHRAIITVLTLLLFSVNAYAQECNIVYGINATYLPYEWINEDGQPEGMNIDLLKAIAKAADCTYTIVYYPYAERIQKLESGSIDMISISSLDEVDNFAVNIPSSFVIYRYIFTRTDSAYIEDIEELRGKTVLATNNTYSKEKLDEIKDEYNINAIGYDSSAEAVKALSDGVGDAMLATLELVLNDVENMDIRNIRSSGYPLYPAIYGFTMNRNNAEMYDRTSKALDNIKKTGEYFEIVRMWNVRPMADKTSYAIFFIILGITVGIVAAVLAWNKMLHSQVQKKTVTLNNEITVRKSAEEKYFKLSTLFQMVLDSLPEHIYLINAAGGISWANVSDPDASRFPIAKIENEIKNAIAKHESFEFTRISDDAITWFIVGIILSEDENRLLLTLTDITENTKLRDEALMAARLAAIGEMAATIAHDINNPTGLIIHNMDFLKQLTKEVYSYLDEYMDDIKGDFSRYVSLDWPVMQEQTGQASEIVDMSLERIIKTVDSLKEFCVVKSSVYEEIDIRRAINMAVKFANFFINKHTNNFTYIVDDAVLPVYGNSLHIEQVTINLLQNACYSLTDKNQRIACLVNMTEDKKYAKVTVADEGCGIDPEILDKVWDPFFTTRKNQGGTGLGLSITSRIVREHKGYYELISTPGKGTEISLYFPVVWRGEHDIDTVD